MHQCRNIAVIGNALPRRCGIATFTSDLAGAMRSARNGTTVDIVAMTDAGQEYDYPDTVRLEIHDDRIDDYVHAADILNDGGTDIVCLQHEFGIFGGEAGSHLLLLLKRLNMPVVTTLHTVLANPSDQQRRVLSQVIACSARVVVMAEMGRHLLQTVYGVPDHKIVVIPHGIPNTPFQEPAEFKQRLGFADRSVILTFGLLSPNKGLETVIDAMPRILERRPDATYVILGATHPHLIRHQGEQYREQLAERARRLGVEKQVVFANRFVDLPTLLDYVAMSDVYATPYLEEAQVTSGTLAVSSGAGTAVVSTPYWHAREILADGRGTLVPFNDPEAIGTAIADLLTDDAERLAVRERAYAHGREMVWDRVAERYLDLFDQACREWQPRTPLRAPLARRVEDLPAPNLTHLLAMSDDTGLYQHAVGAIPDRSHGYCVDDNARALLLACGLARHGGTKLPDLIISRYAAFIQHAWNQDTRYFRNFMGFNRQWLEPRGSQDSHGRTLWALGECARNDPDQARRQWAADLFRRALPTADGFTATRAQVFTLLGLDPWCALAPRDGEATSMRERMADNLLSLFQANATADWCWFEDGLSYDNPRLCQALILSGRAMEREDMIDTGLRSLRWLASMQTSPAGMFRPVGSDSFGDRRVQPRIFDQQPLEAAAMIAACTAAAGVDSDPVWIEEAARAFAWFQGWNDQNQPLADENGGCRDGLRHDGLNQNRGGESVWAYQQGLLDLRRLLESRSAVSRSRPLAVQALRKARPRLLPVLQAKGGPSWPCST